MTFKHKLAHRLALLRDRSVAAAVAALALLWVASCERPLTVTEPNASVAQLVVSPRVVTLQENQSQDFTAVGFTTTGDTALIGVTWSVTGGTIDTSSNGKRHYGHYKNANCGNFKIIASSHPGDKRDTASATVTCPVVSGAQSTVAATPASLTAGSGSATVTVTVKDANGMPLSGVTVALAATGSGNTLTQPSGTTNANGVATGTLSSTVTGSKTVSATANGTGITQTASVTVGAGPVSAAQSTVAASPTSIVVGSGTSTITVTAKDANGNRISGATVVLAATGSGNMLTQPSGTTNTSGVATGTLSSSVAEAKTVSATINGTAVTQTAAVTVTAASAGGQFGHVFVVTEENTNYSSVIGSSSMPYLNGLAQQYGLATQYYANTHPSIGNYFELSTGQIISNNDNFSTVQNVPNVVRSLLAAGKTWKSYAESIPNACYLGGDTGNYARKHNIFPLLSDVANDPVQACNNVPFTQFATDLANGTLPHFSNIVPNLCNDAHDCGLSTADAWLKNNIDPLIKSATFQRDGLLIIVFDESGGDNTNGGGRVVWVAVSPKSKLGYQSTTLYQHQSTLRLTLQGLGVTVFPGAAASAPDMSEFFTP